MRIRSMLGAVIVLASLSVNGTEYQAGDWKLSVTLVPDKPSVILGEPAWFSFKVENLSEVDLGVMVGGDYRNQFGRPDSFKIKTTAKDGRVLPKVDVMCFGGLVGPSGLLKAKGSYVFRLLLSDWVKINAPDEYTISVVKTLEVVKADSKIKPGEWKRVKAETDVSAKIVVEPVDAKRLGEIIDALGAAVIAKKEKAGEAQKGLSSLNDPRVIPWMLKILDAKDYSTKFYAILNLTKFDTPETVDALKKMLDIKAEDLSDTNGNRMPVPSLATNLRIGAVHALAESKRPEVKQYLIEHRNDTLDEFRLTVCHMLGRTKTDQSIAILKEMTKDSYPLVRSEAERYLKEFEEKD